MLLRNSGRSLSVLAGLVGLPVSELREQVVRFVGVGVVELHGDTVVVRSPQEALSRLINEEFRKLQRRGGQLDAVRTLLPSLSAEHLSATAPQGTPVTIEVVEGGDVAQLIRTLSASSTGDLMWVRPDQWRFTAGVEIDAWVRDLLASGRRSRALYPARVLEEAPDVIADRAEAGEHVRVLAEVPCRLSILGTSAVLISEDLHQPGPRRLVIRQKALVELATMLFEGMWDRAMPVPGLDGHRHDGGTRGRALLIDQLSRGAKDEQIARALGISLRTVRRRVADLLDELGAESRFQAGVEAVRRGWV